jgi:hypothetical protein
LIKLNFSILKLKFRILKLKFSILKLKFSILKKFVIIFGEFSGFHENSFSDEDGTTSYSIRMPWWNDAIETQAIDRCHRVGQTRPVRVYRLVMKDTIEERLLNVQKAKAALGKGSLQKLNIQEEKMAKVTTLKDLFAIKSGIDSGEDWL